LVPVVGAVVVPAMALISFLAYRSAFIKLATARVHPTTDGLPGAPRAHAELQP